MKLANRFAPAACAALLVTALASVRGPAWAQADSNSAPNAADQQFVTQAIAGGEQEIAQARAELQSTTNPGVKLFARTMIKDHTAADAEIAAVARQLGLNVPKPSPALALPAAMPDAAYMSNEVTEHQKTIALFKGEKANGSSQMATVAGEIEPTLSNHLAMAQQYVRTGRVSPEPPPSPAP